MNNKRDDLEWNLSGQDKEFKDLIEQISTIFYDMDNPASTWADSGSRAAIIMGLREIHGMPVEQTHE